MMTTRFRLAVTAASLALLAGGAFVARRSTAKAPAPIELPSTSDTVVWGHFPIDAPPALTIPSGTTVRMHTLSHQGMTTRTRSPVEVFGDFGVQPSEVLTDAVEVWANEPRPTGSSVHVLTGPVYVEGAEPGDTLEVRVVDLEYRVPYGINSTGPGRGVLPTLLTSSFTNFLRIDGKHCLFRDDVEIPLKPFMGIMAVAPADDFVSPIEAAAAAGIVSSSPPGPFGGNMDLNDLGIGTSVYFPVFQEGGQFFTGDSHAVQGNGEVDGGALELSLTGTFQFVLHKGGNLRWPRAETPTHFIAMGIDLELQEAMKIAVNETVDFLVAAKGMTPAEAYHFSSMAVDFNVAENVDVTELVMGRIPKRFFRKDWLAKPRFWKDRPVREGNEEQRSGLSAF